MNEKILVAEGKIIQLEFTHFEVHACKDCKDCDFLKISDGGKRGKGEKLLLSKTDGCGSHLVDESSANFFALRTIYSVSNSITIYFQTDDKDQENSSGWRIAWSAVDPGVIFT